MKELVSDACQRIPEQDPEDDDLAFFSGLRGHLLVQVFGLRAPGFRPPPYKPVHPPLPRSDREPPRHGRSSTEPDCLPSRTLKQLAAVGWLTICIGVDCDVFRNAAGKPIPLDGTICVHGTCPIACAGLIRTRLRGGTSRVTNDPASIKEP